MLLAQYSFAFITYKEKDIGVTISADWNVSEQCRIAARKEMQLLGMIKIIIITHRKENLIIPLTISKYNLS